MEMRRKRSKETFTRHRIPNELVSPASILEAQTPRALDRVEVFFSNSQIPVMRVHVDGLGNLETK